MIDPIASRITPLGARLASEAGAAGNARAAAEASVQSLSRKAVPDPATVETGGIARALSQSAPIDEAKVAALKAAVQTSSYAVDPGKIAEAMIRSLKG